MATTVSLKPNAVEISGSTSGTTTLQATAVAGTTTLTLPAATDTLIGKATTDTLTNKTLTGAAMNGTLGATTPSTGAFTTLSSTGNVTVGNTTGERIVSIISTDNNSFYKVAPGNGATGGYRFNNSAGTQHWNIFQTTGAAGQQGNLAIYNEVGASQVLTLDTSGNLLVGTTSDLGAKFNVSTGTRAWAGWFQQTQGTGSSGILVEYSAAAPNSATDYFGLFRDNAAQRIQLRSNGGIGNYQANDVNLSDCREKTNFAPAKSYLDVICAIPVQTFNYIDQNMEDDGGLTLGVVAQDVQTVAPELVMESNWAKEGDEPKMRLSIYQTDLQYALMKCIQEQQALITTLTARITALESA